MARFFSVEYIAASATLPAIRVKAGSANLNILPNQILCAVRARVYKKFSKVLTAVYFFFVHVKRAVFKDMVATGANKAVLVELLAKRFKDLSDCGLVAAGAYDLGAKASLTIWSVFKLMKLR